MTRNIIIGIILFVLGMTLVYSQDSHDVIAGSGVLTAEGDGAIALNGSGEVTITGKGNLFIVDRTHTATINIESDYRLYHRERRLRDNRVFTYSRFNGTATIAGDDIAVVMDGTHIQMSISGTGMVLLAGDGHYTLNNQTTDWTSDGTTISLNYEGD